MKLRLPKALAAAVLAACTAFNTYAETITYTKSTDLSDLSAYPDGCTGIIVDGGTLNLGTSAKTTLSDGITVNDGGVIVYGGNTQTCFAPATAVQINAGGTLKLTGSNDGLGWSNSNATGAPSSLTLEGTDGNTAQLLTYGRITLDTPLNLNGYAIVGKTDDAVTTGVNRASLDTLDEAAINVSGSGNLIDVDVILRNNANIVLTGGATLDIDGTVVRHGSELRNQQSILVSGSGDVSFNKDVEARALSIGAGSGVTLNGDTSSFADNITNNGELTLNGVLVANTNTNYAHTNQVITDASGNVIDANNGRLTGFSLENLITGSGTTTVGENAKVRYNGTDYAVTSTGNQVLLQVSDVYAVNENAQYDAAEMSTSEIWVLNGATLDVNGKAVERKTVTLYEGATLANTGNNVGDSSGIDLMQNSHTILVGNATFDAQHNFSVVGPGHVESFLELNGHTLTKTGAGKLFLMNTTVNAGTIDIQQGEIILKQNGTHTAGMTVSNGTVFQVGANTQLTFDSSFTGSEPGNIILNATGTGTINTHGNVLIPGNTGDTAASSAFAGTINVAGGTLSLGNHGEGENYGWKLNMEAATIKLNGGQLYFFGKTSNLGDIEVQQNATYTLHATDDDDVVTHGDINIAKDKTLTIKSNWTSKLIVDSVEGEGNLILENGANTPNLVMTVENLRNSGTISLSNRATLTVTNANISHSIANEGSLTFNGTLTLGEGCFTLADQTYQDLDGSTESGNGFLTSAKVGGVITGSGSVATGENVSLNIRGANSTSVSYADSEFTATFAPGGTYYVGANNTVTQTREMALQATAGYVVNAGGKLIIANNEGDVLKNRFVVLMEGATLADEAHALDGNRASFNRLELLGDAYVEAKAQFGILAGGWADTKVNLNDHTLTKTGADIFHICNSTISSGTIKVQDGTLQLLRNNTVNGTKFILENDAVLSFRKDAYSDLGTIALNNVSFELAKDAKLLLNNNQSGAVLTDIVSVTKGTGTIDLADVNAILLGTTDPNAITTFDFAGTIAVNRKTLYFGKDADPYEGNSLAMDNATISLQGGDMVARGDKLSLGKLIVNKESGYTNLNIYEVRANSGGQGLSIGTVQLDSALTLTANWNPNAHFGLLTGEGDMYVWYDMRGGALFNVSIDQIQDYTGKMVLGANTNGEVIHGDMIHFTIGTESGNSTLGATITNHADLTLKGNFTVEGPLNNFTVLREGTDGGLHLNGTDGYRITTGNTYLLIDNNETGNLNYTAATITYNGKQVTETDDGDVVFVGAQAMGTTYHINTVDVSLGGENATADTERATDFVVAAGRTLHLYERTGMLANTTGDGNIALHADAKLLDGQNTTATGKLSIGKDATLTIGDTDQKTVSIASFSTVELDGGKIIIHNSHDTFHNFTVTEAGGEFYNSDHADAESTFAGTTTLNGNLAFTADWDGQYKIEKLTGTGDLSVSSGHGRPELSLKIQELENYGGTLSADRVKLTLGADITAVDNKLDFSNATVTVDANALSISKELKLASGTNTLKGETFRSLDIKDSIVGSGSLHINTTQPMNATISGDVSGWTGGNLEMLQTGTITFTGKSTELNLNSIHTTGELLVKFDNSQKVTANSILGNGDGSMHLELTAGTYLQANKAIHVNDVTLGAGSTLQLTAVDSALTLAGDATLSLVGSTLQAKNGLSVYANLNINGGTLTLGNAETAWALDNAIALCSKALTLGTTTLNLNTGAAELAVGSTIELFSNVGSLLRADGTALTLGENAKLTDYFTITDRAYRGATLSLSAEGKLYITLTEAGFATSWYWEGGDAAWSAAAWSATDGVGTDLHTIESGVDVVFSNTASTITVDSDVTAGSMEVTGAAYTFNGAGTITTDSLVVTDTGSATFNTGIEVKSSLVSTGNLTAQRITGTGSVTITGGVVTLSDATDAFANTGTTHISNATLAGTWRAEGITLNAATIGENAHITLADSTISSTLTNNGTLTLSGHIVLGEGIKATAGTPLYSDGDNGFETLTSNYNIAVGGTTNAAAGTVWTQNGTELVGDFDNGTLILKAEQGTVYYVNSGNVIYDAGASFTGATGLCLNGGNLQLNTAITADGFITAGVDGGTIQLNSQTLKQSSLGALGGAVLLDGTGTYSLGSGVSALASRLSLAETWQGTVELESVSGLPLDLTSLLQSLSTDAGSVKVTDVTGHFTATELGTNLILNNKGDAAAITINNGFSKLIYDRSIVQTVFTGDVSGSGDIKFAWGTGSENKLVSYNFSGDVSEWKGSFLNAATGAGVVEVVFTSDTDINANILNTEDAVQDSALWLEISGFSAINVNGEINVDKLTLANGTGITLSNSVTASNAIIYGPVTVNAGVTLTVGDTQVYNTITNNGTLVLNGAVTTGEELLTISERVFTDVDGTTTSGNGFLSSAIISGLADGTGSITLGDAFNITIDGAVYGASDVAVNGNALSLKLAEDGAPAYYVRNESVTRSELIAYENSKVTADTAFIINGGSLTLSGNESMSGDLISYGEKGGSLVVTEGSTLTNANAHVANISGAGTIELAFDGTFRDRIETSSAFTGSVYVTSGAFVLSDNALNLKEIKLGDGTRFRTDGDTVLNAALTLTGNVTQSLGTGNLSINNTVSGAYAYTKQNEGNLTFNKVVSLGVYNQQDTINKGYVTTFGGGATIGTLNADFGEVAFSGDKENTVDSLDISNEATIRVKGNTALDVTTNMWQAAGTDVILEEGAQLRMQGINISGIKHADNTHVNFAGDSSQDRYTTNNDGYVITNAAVEITASNENGIDLNNKLVNSALTHNGSGVLRVNNEENSLTALHAMTGDINVRNSEAVEVDLLTIATGRTVGVHSNDAAIKDPENEGSITVITKATFDDGAALYADLVLDGAELVANGTLTLGSDVTLKAGGTLSGALYEQLLTMTKVGEGIVLFEGVDNLFLGDNETPSGAITLGHVLKANTYFTNLDSMYNIVYTPGEGNGVVSIQIPEPTTVSLSLLALAALASRRRRR